MPKVTTTNSYPPNLITDHSFATYNLYQGENPTA
ncbi:unnamed protein product, partial [Rotaria sp. Silwood1]